jgi:hypothetical protein
MGRLIDADEFKDYISEGYEQHKNEVKTKEYRKLADEITKGFLLDIDKQSTVYDVDKVIQKVQETIRAYDAPTENCLGNPNCKGTDCAYCLSQEITAIIREGGNL